MIKINPVKGKKMVALISNYILVIGLCVFRNIVTSDGASAHIHTHHNNKDAASHERTEDGAFSPRDMEHYADGDHHQEFDHEAILGSVKKADEFDKLPPEVAKERLAILLKKMDLNNDQYIERNELRSWILRSFSMLSTEESEDRLDDADTNEDGKVSWDEILQDTYGSDVEDLAEEDKLIQDDRATFNAADLDGNGYLDSDEFRAYTHPEETARMFPLLLQQALDDKDSDKDGYISFQEFLGDRARGEDKEWLLVEKDKFDHDYDKNQDGRLDSEEILAWLVPSNEDIATQESDHLFASSDDDHDDRLSFDEILDHHDVFVGSEATDYGEHLHNIDHFKDEL